MARKYYGILTTKGRALYANALLLNQDVNLSEMAIDDTVNFLPDEKLESLPSEVYRAELNSLEKDDDNDEMVIAELVIPSQRGGFYCRGFGLYTDTGILFAVGSLAETYKATEDEGSGGELVIQADIVVTNTAALVLKVDPTTVLATRETVDRAIAAHEAKLDPHPQYAPKNSPTLTGIPKAPTPAAGDNTTQIATTAFVQAIVTALNTALALKAPLASPGLTGIPTAPTAAQSTNNTQIATTAFVKSAIAALVASSPEALDTLNELAAALGNDPNFATTITNALAGKQPLDSTLTNLSGKDVAGLLSYLGLGDMTETLDALRLSGALVSRGRKALNPMRIFFGADSLSEGTPDSYTQIVGGMMGAKTAQSGLLVPCRKSLVSNVSGFLEGRDAGTRGVYPRTYSLSGDALYGDELVNATMRHLPMVTSGVQMAWKKARLYYLAQPGGGTFDFRQYSASGTKGDIVSVDTHSDVYQIQYAEIAINPGVSQAYTEVLNGNGKLCLFLLEYINSDNDYVIFNGAQGGASAQDWNRLNKETQRQWMSLLRFDTCVYNAGTNDRYSRTADDFRQDLSGYLTNLASADNAPHIIVVVPTQTKDYASTHAKDYPDVYSSVAEANGFGFISMPLCLGDYATCSKRFGMLADGIHPSKAAHRAFGFFFASLLNMSVKNEPRPVFSAGGGGSDANPYEVDFSKWYSNNALVKGGVRTLIATFQPGAPYIHVYVDIEVAARVNPGVFSFIERRMRIHMRSGGSSANITQAQVLLNEEKTKLIESGWGFTFSTDADTSTGTLQIFMEVSRDCNIFSRVTDVRVLLGSVAAKGSALKMINML